MANAATATFAGRSIITARLRGLGTEPKNISWGTSAITGSSNSDVNLFAPATESRVAGTSTMVATSFLADTYQVVGSITCLVSGKTITEAGLFDSPTLSPTTTLASTVTSNAVTTLTLSGAVGPSTGNFYAQVGNEVVLVTGGQNTATITVVRAQLGSSPGASYAVGTAFTPGGDGGSYVNAALGGASSTWTAALGGSLFAHADFAGIAVSVNDSINFTFRDQFS